jgi:hypothetical protein
MKLLSVLFGKPKCSSKLTPGWHLLLAWKRARIFFSLLLVLTSSLALVPPHALSQSYSTSTWQVTTSAFSTYPISTSSQYVTTTVYQGDVQLSRWGTPGCAVDVPLTALPGDLVSVRFNSNVPIDFHIISAGPKFFGIADVFCGFGVPPGSLEEAASQTTYSVQWTPSEEYYRVNKVTEYFLILDNWQTTSAAVHLSAQETPNQTVTSTILATSTLMYTNLYTQTISNTHSPGTSTTTSYVQTAQNNQWQILLAIIPVPLIIMLLLKRRKKRVEKTRIY